MGEALFKKHNKNKNNEVKSAGVMLDPLYLFAHKNVIISLREFGAPIVDEKSRELDQNLINWADKIIIVADNVNPKIFDEKDIQVWKISDTDQTDVKGIKERIKKIDKKVKALIKKLG